jgi:hypothetical protein
VERRRKSHNRHVIQFAIEIQQLPRLEQDVIYGMLLAKRTRSGRVWEIAPVIIGAEPLILGASNTHRRRGHAGYDLLSKLIDD